MEEKKEKINGMAVLSYIGFLCFIPLLSKDQDEFVKFHAKQGFVLFLLEAATWMIFYIVPVLFFLGQILGLAWLVLSILGIVNVLNKEKKELPLIGKFADKVKF